MRSSDNNSHGGAAFPLWVAVLLLVVIGGTPCLRVLHIRLLYDDIFLIVINPFIRDASSLWDYLDAGRPLRSISLYLDYTLWGYNPRGYHFTNLVLHLVSAVVWFRFLDGRFTGRWLAWGSALLFTVHPAVSEALAVVSHRKEMLAFIFLVSALWCYTAASGADKAIESGELNRVRRVPYVFSLLFYLLGLGSKQVVIVLPLLAFTADVFLSGKPPLQVLRRRAVWYVPYLALPVLLMIFSVGDWRIFGYMPINEMFGEFHWRALGISGWSVSAYLRILTWPIFLSADYQFKTPQWWSVLFGAFLWLTLLWAGLRLRAGNRGMAFGLIWIPLNLLMVLNLIPINQPLADRYLYIPLAGFCLFLVSVFDFAARRESKIWAFIRWMGLTAIGIIALNNFLRTMYEQKMSLSMNTAFSWIAVALFMLLVLRATTRSDRAVSFWRTALFLAIAFIATAWLITPFMARSLEGEWKKPLHLTPEKKNTYNIRLIRKEVARPLFSFNRQEEIAIRIVQFFIASILLGMLSAWFVSNPFLGGNRKQQDWMAVVGFIILLFGALNHSRLKEWKDPRRIWNATLRTDPMSQRANVNLGVHWIRRDRPERAIWHYKRAVTINPHNHTAWRNIGLLSLREKDYERAESAFRRVVAIKPQDEAAHLNLGNIYVLKGKEQEALDEYRKVLAVNPENARVYYNIASIQENKGNKTSAYENCRKAIELRNDFTKARQMCGPQGRLKAQDYEP